MKLNIAYIIEGDEDVFELSYNSIKDVADRVIIINGNEEGYYFQNAEKVTELCHGFPHEEKGAMGIQRNKYLEYLKEHHLGEWTLVLDADEVVENPEHIKVVIKQLEENNKELAHVKMRHLIGDLGHEDSTLEEHWCLGRLFKVTKDLYYPETEHCLLQGYNGPNDIHVKGFTLFHLGYCREMFRIRNKTLNHREKSEIHQPEFLDWWSHAHLLGTYPRKEIPYHELPKIIREYFNLNEDYVYFKDRNVELKHAECVKQWNEHFKPENVLDIGCGRGPYLRYWEMITECNGIEISDWAIKNKICTSDIITADITKPFHLKMNFDLVTAIDILEHVEESELPKALNNIREIGNRFLFSIPFEGDPNLYADYTHKIFKPKEWWIEQLEKAGFKIQKTPDNWYYKEQMVVAKK